MKTIWYFLETRFTLVLWFFGRRYDESVIPHGHYCYTIDHEREKTEPISDGHWINTCPYYRHTKKTGGIACTYVGFWGFDVCLYDSCKICGVNKNDY